MTPPPDPLLVTKLFVPSPPPALVSRPRLLAALHAGLDRRLCVVCAPAGFGKTTLLSEWVAASARPVAWVSLDAADSDPARFLAYLVAGLRTVAPGLDEQHLQARSTPLEPVLVRLLNELSTRTTPVVLVLDDFHAVDSAAVDAAVTFLVEHAPPQLHVVVATRQDPDLPLARLRARGQLTELRAADLRFTTDEAGVYLTSVGDLHLTAHHVATLGRRTEGWIAGLQLAALSLRGTDDVSAFVDGFAGDTRFVADYLVGEVLERQPDDVRSFLLQTAVLDRLSGPLCDAVTRRSDGGARLEALERANLFVVPLDDRRHWYRYHHLFAEVLRVHLVEAEQASSVATLHRRAAAWYERNGPLAEAVRHGLAAGDAEHVADLVEVAAPAMSQARQEVTLLGWLRALPDEVLGCRPVLNAEYAGVLLACGLLPGVESRLDAAERWLDPAASRAGMVAVDHDGLGRLPGSIAMWRAGARLVSGDPLGSVRHARRAIELSAQDDHLTRGGAAALLGLAAWGEGELEEAFARYTECVQHLTSVGSVADVVGCSITLADLRLTQGRLRAAEEIYEHGLRLATTSGPVLRGAADMHVGLAELHLQRGDLDRAQQHLTASQELGDGLGLPQHPYRSRVAAAHLRAARSDLDGAAELLHAAEGVYASDFSPGVRPVAAIAARLWLVQGRLDDALRWARAAGVSADDALSYLREYEHVTLAAVLLAQRRLPAAAALLDRLLQAADAGGRTGSALEVLVLQALVHQARGDAPAALGSVRRALALGEPEGWVRVFVEAGPAMTELLHAAARQGTARPYVRRLLAQSGGRSAPRSQGPGRRPERARARRPGAARRRPQRPADRAAARGLAAHRAQPHQEHLRQARRQQPSDRGARGRGPAPAAPAALTAAHLQRTPRTGRTARPPSSAQVPARPYSSP